MMPTPHLAPTGALGGLNVYRTATAANPTGHGLGGGETCMMPPFLRGLALTECPDASLITRRAALCLIAALALSQTSAAVSLWVNHLVVAQLQGQRVGTTLCIWDVDGTITLPSAHDAALILQLSPAVLISEDMSPLNAFTAASFTLEDGVPCASGRALKITNLIRSVACSTGGTAPMGRAPPSIAEGNVRKGKGKGRKGGK